MIYLYSKTIEVFLQRCLGICRQILTNEMGIPCKQRYFSLDDFHYRQYPISLVIFEDPKVLGAFHSDQFKIAINKVFIHQIDERPLKNLLRHELAHYVLYLVHGSKMTAHGSDFRDFCRKCGWGEEVYMAKQVMNDGESISSQELTVEQINLTEKIKKLFNLASSSNIHESELATAKANELLLKYNLQHVKTEDLDTEFVVKEVYRSSRSNSKLVSISRILSHFLVDPIHCRREEYTCIQVTGSRLNVELAHYIADFLDLELELMWKQNQRLYPKLKGMRAKNSFFIGVADGHISKIEAASKNQTTPKQEGQLIVVNRQLREISSRFYGGLSSTRSQSNIDPYSNSLGEKAGKEMQLRSGISSHSSETYLISN